MNLEIKLKNTDLSYIQSKSTRDVINENELQQLRADNAHMKFEIDVLRKRNVEQHIWEKRVDDLKMEVQRLDKELWQEKDRYHKVE